MNRLAYWILFGGAFAYLILIVLWLRAEHKSAKKRITLGVFAILSVVPITAVFSIAITQLDDQSYYTYSISHLLDETITALDSNDRTFLERLKTFRRKQDLTYEYRGDLQDNVRKFEAEGQIIRGRTNDTTAPAELPKLLTEQAGSAYPRPVGPRNADP